MTAAVGVEMKSIVTSYGSYLTGTEIADAVTAYGLALARAHGVDVVDIPFVAADGSVNRVSLRVGWLSDMAVVSAAAQTDEVLEIETILAILTKTSNIGGRRGTAFASEDIKQFLTPDGNWDDII